MRNLALLHRLVVPDQAGEDGQARGGRRRPPVRPRRTGPEIEHRAGVGVKAAPRRPGVVRLVDLALLAHQHGGMAVLVRRDGQVERERIRPRLALRRIQEGHLHARLRGRHHQEGLAVRAAEARLELERARAHEGEVVVRARIYGVCRDVAVPGVVERKHRAAGERGLDRLRASIRRPGIRRRRHAAVGRRSEQWRGRSSASAEDEQDECAAHRRIQTTADVEFTPFAGAAQRPPACCQAVSRAASPFLPKIRAPSTPSS